MFLGLEFIAFFIALLWLLRVLPSSAARRALLLASSLFALAWLDWISALVLLWISWSSWRLSRSRRPTHALLAVAHVLLVLGYFKYSGSIAGKVSAVLAALGLPLEPSAIAVVLPLGISFYAFQSVAYSIDVSKGKVEPTPIFAAHLLQMAFFPKVAMGPIERADRLALQLSDPGRASAADLRLGLGCFAFGLMKKLAISDHLGPYVASVYSNPAAYGAGTLWLATLAYSLQLYCDFSGYCDMAVGVARMMGVRLTENFAQPYLAVSIKDFWRRWHVSLSSWLGEYIYKPLGGRTDGLARQCLNIVIVFLVSGVWHGATWNFVLWGAIHGLMYIVYLCWRSLRPSPENPGAARLVLAWAITMLGVLLSRVVFRSADISSALQAYQGMLGREGKIHVDPAVALALPATLMLVVYELRGGRAAPPFHERMARRSPLAQWALVFVLLLVALGLQSKESANFIYFRF